MSEKIFRKLASVVPQFLEKETEKVETREGLEERHPSRHII